MRARAIDQRTGNGSIRSRVSTQSYGVEPPRLAADDASLAGLACSPCFERRWSAHTVMKRDNRPALVFLELLAQAEDHR